MTELSTIYDSFLSMISDYRFFKISPEALEDELFVYFKKARAKFYKCKKKLSISKDDNSLIEDELSDYEIEVITNLMLVEYMKPIIISSEIVKQSMSDKDFKVYSQANQLRELNLLYKMLRAEANKMINEYTYMGMTDK